MIAMLRVRRIASAVCVTAVLAAGTALAAPEALPPVETVGGVSLPPVPRSVATAAIEAAEASRESDTAAADGSGPAADSNMTLKVIPGTTDLVRIARGYLNRLVVPFDDPKLLTANPLEVRKEGRSLFVTTNSERPVGVHILPNDPSDTRSISLTLIPARIPPKTITLTWSDEAAAMDVPLSSARAKRWEEAMPFQETLAELARTIARGEVPEGYSLSAHPEVLPCELSGVTYFTGQRLTGHHFSAFVLRATNTGTQTIELLGHAGCNVPGVRLVAPWPSAFLTPGASTELYVVVSNEVYEPAPATVIRPSLLVR